MAAEVYVVVVDGTMPAWASQSYEGRVLKRSTAV